MSSSDSIKITYCLIRVKSNGLLEQWGFFDDSSRTHKIPLYINYSSASSYNAQIVQYANVGGAGEGCLIRVLYTNQIFFDSQNNRNVLWFTNGY